jgi:hypothetical protein
MLAVHSPQYTSYVAYAVGDYYDSGIGTWMLKDLQVDAPFSDNGSSTTINSSPYFNYIIGMMVEDSDETNGFGAGPDFASSPEPGYNSYNLGMMVAAMSPLEAANSYPGYVYANTRIYSKLALRNALATEYGTVAALNTAWGSSYTTFDSSGTCVGSQPITCASSVSADSIGTGNGSTLTFTTTLSLTTISGFSLQILVAGTPVAGDNDQNGYSAPNGTLWGPNASGTINYSTGALSITFTAGNAPANGAAITATYVANGWRIGTGFLDEDDRVSHQGWMGSDWTAMSNANSTVKADMNTFLQALAAQYFSTCRTQLKAVFPNVMYLGPDSLSSYGIPSPAPVLKAAGSYIDAFLTLNYGQVYTQAMMDYIESNYGDKPYFGSYYAAANPDSAMSSFSKPYCWFSGCFTTQAAKGTEYYNEMVGMLQTTHTTSGNYAYIGLTWWAFTDLPNQGTNWGLVTDHDNAYDGHEAASGSVTCSAPLAAYTCGGEPTPSGGGAPPFGDLITPVKSANALWLSIQ